MKRTCTFFGVGGLIALFAVAAVCQGYQANPPAATSVVPSSPPFDSPPARQTGPTTAPGSGKTADPLVPQKTGSVLSCCKGPAPSCCAVPGTATPAARHPNVYDLLEKLEALKAKQNALESEVRETRALLNEKFRTLQERMGKVGAGLPTPVAYEVPLAGSRYYEPVTTYQTLLVKDPQTGGTRRVVRPVTSYVLREAGVPVAPPATTEAVPAPLSGQDAPPPPPTKSKAVGSAPESPILSKYPIPKSVPEKTPAPDSRDKPAKPKPDSLQVPRP
jgi:hypothetical protein